MQYPPLPFSPPIPSPSVAGNQAIPGFPFPAPFVTSATQSPALSAGASPSPFGAVKFNPRASISIPSPHAWSSQLMLQQGHRVGSPSLANLGAIMSPTSPFSPDGMPGPPGHQRHQSLQFSALPQQFQPPVRASPRLQELREVDEEATNGGDSKPAGRGFVRHNPSDSLQKEIDEAEYHLEEQMRSQLENDQDYSPHNEHDKVAAAQPATSLPHAERSSSQFAPQAPRFAGDADGLVLHHPRPHSRGHSLSQKYFTEDDASKEAGFKPTLQKISAQPAEDSEIETNPSNLGTPVQPMDFSKLLHQRGFSTASNPWADEPSKSANGSHQSRPSHGSKSSFSKLNVEAPEFKFDPANTFKTGQFAFSGAGFQPAAFSMGLNPAESNQPSYSAVSSSKINAGAPVFAPGQSDFNFSSSGPKFRPDAPAFTPHSLPTSVTNPGLSGGESGGNAAGSIFGNIDLSGMDIIKPAKKSKAIPIVKPGDGEPQERSGEYDDDDGRLADDSRVKRARAKMDNDDSVPLFAEPTKDDTTMPEPRSETAARGDAVPAEEKSLDESNAGLGDTTMSSTMASETTDTKATVSPSETSPDQAAVNWTPFELQSSIEIQAFNEARAFGSDAFKPAHKKSLSATAKAFVPGTVWDGPGEQAADAATHDLAGQPAGQSGAALTANATNHVGSAVVPVDQIGEDQVVESIEKPVEEQVLTAPASAATSQADHGAPAPAPSGLSASRYARSSASSPPPLPKKTGLAASRFAVSPSPAPHDGPFEEQPAHQTAAGPDDEHAEDTVPHEPTLADIDEVMRRLGENPDMGVNRTYHDPPQWHEPGPDGYSPLAAVPGTRSQLATDDQFRSNAASPSPSEQQQAVSTAAEDRFFDEPRSVQSAECAAIHRLNGSESLPASDWEGVFSEAEQAKFESRVAFFDGRVHDLVGDLLAARLGPLEQTLESINHTLAGFVRHTPTSRQGRRSISADIPESDADDEDEEVPPPLRSMSPRRDRRMEQIRAAVLDAFAIQRRNQPEAAPAPVPQPDDNSAVLKALDEIKEQFRLPPQPAFNIEDLRVIVEEAVERHVPVAPEPVVDNDEQLDELRSRIAELEQRLRDGEVKFEAEAAKRRDAENRFAEANRELQSAATRIEVEMMNKSALNQRIADLEDRVQHAERQAEEEIKGRRAAEDRLSEVQRLLRISSEEETRLRELVEEKEQRIKSAESAQRKSAMRLALLEANQDNAQKTQTEAQNRINVLEIDVREAKKECEHWRSETERIIRIARQSEQDLARALDENKALHKLIDTLGTQLQENERVRDNWRSKFISMQEEMAQAARDIAEENARRTRKENALLARQEVLEARLQAEAKTRERIETELERLEMGERQGMRAVAECKRLEAILVEMRAENHKLQQRVLRYQAEFQEARESGAREVQRTRDAMQSEIDNANHQVNVVREELEEQVARLRAQLDQVKLDADTAKARHEMLLEEAQNSKRAELGELARKHQNEIEDLQARYERQLSNTTEDAQRAEQNLLERLSISTSKTEHLQDKVAHLEEKLEIAKEAARAAAQAAKSVAGSEAVSSQPKPTSVRQLEPPEKISPQALRESIMVLQEQLQEREQRIEELEDKLSKVDPEAETKILKRDDEIIWLRELLAVRHSDLQDIISALGQENFDRNAVKDAAIRLKANLQMEEQERERAMNGGSAINLPNIAATIRDAATPRVAQAVGPLAAALGSWRRGGLSSPASGNGRDSTPSRRGSGAQGGFLGGLLTPPTSQAKQPTAFSSTGRRFTPQDLANRPRPPPALVAANRKNNSSNQKGKAVAREETPPPPQQAIAGPITPPMMQPSSYDADAQATEDFDDAEFFEDEE